MNTLLFVGFALWLRSRAFCGAEDIVDRLVLNVHQIADICFGEKCSHDDALMVGRENLGSPLIQTHTPADVAIRKPARAYHSTILAHSSMTEVHP